MECLLGNKSVHVLSFTVGIRFFLLFNLLLDLGFGFLYGSSFLGSFGNSSRQRILFLP